jgi:hypothetical protein
LMVVLRHHHVKCDSLPDCTVIAFITGISSDSNVKGMLSE